MSKVYDYGVDALTVVIAAVLLLGGVLGLLCVAAGIGIKVVGNQLIDALINSMEDGL